MPVGKTLYKSLYWRILQFVTSFIINIVLARTFQSVISAEFYAIVYLLSLSIGFFTLGLDISLPYYLSRKEMMPGMARRIIFLIVTLALLCSLCALRLFYQPSRYPDLTLFQLLLLAACQLAGGLLTALSTALFTAYGQNYLPGKITFFFNAGLLLLCLVVSRIYSGAAAVNGLFRLYFSFSLLQGLSLFVLSARLYPGRVPRPPSNRNFLHRSAPQQSILHRSARPLEILRFSFAAFLTNFLFFAGTRLCLYLLPYRVSADARGNYIQAYKIVEYMSVLISAVYYPVIALAAAEDKEKMKERVLFLVRISNTFVLLTGLCILVVGRWLFPFVFGSSFDRMYGIFIGFLPGLFAVCSSTFFTAYYFGSGRLKYNFIGACIQFGGMLLFFFLLVQDGSPLGAAYAFSLAVLGSLAYDLFIFRRLFFYRLRDMLFISRHDLGKCRQFIRDLLTKS